MSIRFRCYRVECNDPVAQGLGESVYLDVYKAMSTCTIAPFKPHMYYIYLKLNNVCQQCVDLSVYIIYIKITTIKFWQQPQFLSLSKQSNKSLYIWH